VQNFLNFQKKKRGSAWLWAFFGWGLFRRSEWSDPRPDGHRFDAYLNSTEVSPDCVTDASSTPLSPGADGCPALLPKAEISAAQANQPSPQSPNRENRIWRQNLEQPSFLNSKLGRFRPHVDKQSRWSVALASPNFSRSTRKPNSLGNLCRSIYENWRGRCSTGLEHRAELSRDQADRSFGDF
jgi:hypothetical protein